MKFTPCRYKPLETLLYQRRAGGGWGRMHVMYTRACVVLGFALVTHSYMNGGLSPKTSPSLSLRDA